MAKSGKKSQVLTIAIIVVLGLWAVVGGIFLARHQPVYMPDNNDDIIVDTGEHWDRERWLGIYQGRTKIGWLFSRLRKVPDGYEMWNKTRIKLRLLDTVQVISLDLQGRLGPDHAVNELYFEALTDFMNIKARGKREGNDLHLTITTGGEQIEHDIHFERPPTIEWQWTLQQRLKKAGPGDVIAFTTFDPMTQREVPVQVVPTGDEDVKINGQTIPAWKAEIKMANQVEYAWVSKDRGMVIKEYHPGSGYTTLLEGKEKALDVDWEKAGVVDVLVTFMVPSNTSLIEPRGISYLRARLVGAPLDNLDLALSGRQTISGNTVEVAIEQATPAEGYALPISESLPEKSREFSAWLEPTPFIQSDHPKIIEAAKEASGDAADAVTAVDRLLAWTSGEIKPSLVVSIPSALEVLEKREGACKEHTVLFIAMARSLGIPARTVSGIVYSEDMMIEGFYYHAWAEVYLADPEGQGSWVAVDPTFNQDPADATHIKLVEGDLDQMLRLMQVVGKLKVEVEDYR